jgi:hypothetical protein
MPIDLVAPRLTKRVVIDHELVLKFLLFNCFFGKIIFITLGDSAIGLGSYLAVLGCDSLLNVAKSYVNYLLPLMADSDSDSNVGDRHDSLYLRD